jgi:hypothetical protein
VASLDASVAGMLAEMPRVGSAMLFARVDERGRVSLVRTGVVTRFERHRAEDPFVETEKVPSMSVETSAPVIAPSAPVPRASHTALVPKDPYEDQESIERTQPFRALPQRVLHRLRHQARQASAGYEPYARASRRERSALDEPIDDDVTLDKTAEYESDVTRRSWPLADDETAPPTLRQPPMALRPHTEAPYSPARVARRSEPQVVRPLAVEGRSPRPSLPLPSERVASRGRGKR